MHDRGVESDFLLLLLRELSRTRANLRVVLMSATVDTSLFTRYFNDAASLQVPGRIFPVRTVFLEEILQLTGHVVDPTAAWSKGGANKTPFSYESTHDRSERERPDTLLGMHELQLRYPNAPATVLQALATMDHNCINYALCVQVVEWLVRDCPGLQRASDPCNRSNVNVPGSTACEAPPASVNGTVRTRVTRWGPTVSPSETRARCADCGEICSSLWRDKDSQLYCAACWQRFYHAAPAHPPAVADEKPVRSRSPSPYSPTSDSGGGAAHNNNASRKRPCDRRDRSISPQPPPPAGMPGCDAVLVFLPGVKEIQILHQALKQSPCFAHGAEWLLQLHGGLSPEEQLRVFKRPPAGQRKVVLATNVAETSITIDDVGFILDTTRMKETRYDAARRLSSLEDVMVNRDSARQRRGRAGRVAPGVCVHLFTEYTHDHIALESQAPEVKRVPLEQLVLRIHALKIPGGSINVCGRLLEPPSLAAVQRAVSELVSMGALSPPTESVCEQLTRLGIHLSKLPLDARLGKLLLIGASFGPAVTNDALTVAAALSSRTPFMSPQDRRYEADLAKQTFVQSALGPSDHLATVNAYNTWDRLDGDRKYAFCREHFIGVRSLQAIAGLKRQLLEVLSDNGFVRPGLNARYVEQQGRIDDSDGVCTALLGVGASSTYAAAAHQALVTALLCTALFPQVISIIDESDSRADKHVREREYLKGKLAKESRESEQKHLRDTIATVTRWCTRSRRLRVL